MKGSSYNTHTHKKTIILNIILQQHLSVKIHTTSVTEAEKTKAAHDMKVVGCCDKTWLGRWVMLQEEII